MHLLQIYLAENKTSNQTNYIKGAQSNFYQKQTSNDCPIQLLWFKTQPLYLLFYNYHYLYD